jgi:hypothetical protein
MRSGGIKLARNGGAGLALIVAQLCAFILWIGYAITWTNWIGFFGFLIGISTAPGLVIFPLLYWIVENEFPTGYAVVWLIGLVLFTASAVLIED